MQSVVSCVSWVVDGITPHLPSLDPPLQHAVHAYLSALAKVQADELITDASGFVSELPARQRGQQRLASAVDRDASFRKHGDDPAVLGYNAVISTTATRIRAAVALTGATSDSAAPIVVLEQQRDAQMPLPAEMVMDQAAGWGKTRAQVHAISQGQTRLTARVPQSGGSDPSRLGVADFLVDAERTRCTCPNGVVSTKAYASQAGDGVHFRFLASQCRDCPLWSQCRAPNAKPNGHRVVFISDYTGPHELHTPSSQIG